MEAAVLQILIVSSLMVLSQQTALQHVRFMCQQTSLANPAEVLKLRNGDLTNADPKIQKYAYCVYKNLGLTSPDGINKQMGLKMLSPKTDPAMFISSVDKCNNYHNDGTVEESFWKVLNCFDNKYPGDIYVL